MNARDFGVAAAEPFGADPAAERARRIVDCARAYRLLGTIGFGEMGDGHVSARDPEKPDHFWLARWGVSFDRMQPADIVLVGPDGSARTQAGEAAQINMSAYYIHHPIHEARPDAVSAVHVHTPWGTPFAAERRIIEPISQESCVFFEDHALFDDEEVQVLSTDGGKRIAAALGAKRAVSLANHGNLTVGSSVADAVGHFVMMERVCEVQMKARQAIPISAASARIAKDDLTVGDFGWNTFRWLCMRHLGEATLSPH